jgi:hypothetical protein
MLSALDNKEKVSVRKLLDTPSACEDILFATDKWMTKLRELYHTSKELDVRLTNLCKMAI